MCFSKGDGWAGWRKCIGSWGQIDATPQASAKERVVVWGMRYEAWGLRSGVSCSSSFPRDSRSEDFAFRSFELIYCYFAIFINDVRRKIYIEVGLRARAAIGIFRREAWAVSSLPTMMNAAEVSTSGTADCLVFLGLFQTFIYFWTSFMKIAIS